MTARLILQTWIGTGTHPVKVRVTTNRIPSYKPVSGNPRLSVDDFNKILSGKRLPQNLLKAAQDMSTALNKAQHGHFPKGEKVSLSKAFALKMASVEVDNTRALYRTSKNYFAGLDYDDITPEYLGKFEKRFKVNTANSYLRYLRAVFNYAIKNGWTSYYPFKDYTFKRGHNIKKAINIEEIKEFSKSELSGPKKWARDMWLFMYLGNGMNAKDLCLLKWEDVKKDYIIFSRAKTKIPVVVPLSDRLKDIIKEYGVKTSPFLFGKLAAAITEKQIRTRVTRFTRKVNKYSLYKVSAARHSYATVLKRAGVGIEVISEGMGHTSVKTTRNYLDSFDLETMKEASKNLL